MKYFLFILSFFIAVIAQSQISNPATWSFYAKKTKGNVVKIYAKVKLDTKWHIYAQQAGKGPVSTEINFDKNPLLVMKGSVAEEGKLIESFDKAFNTTLRYFEKEVCFTQLFKMRSKAKTEIKGYVYFMLCDDKSCLPPRKEPFTIEIK